MSCQREISTFFWSSSIFAKRQGRDNFLINANSTLPLALLQSYFSPPPRQLASPNSQPPSQPSIMCQWVLIIWGCGHFGYEVHTPCAVARSSPRGRCNGPHTHARHIRVNRACDRCAPPLGTNYTWRWLGRILDGVEIRLGMDIFIFIFIFFLDCVEDACEHERRFDVIGRLGK